MLRSSPTRCFASGSQPSSYTGAPAATSSPLFTPGAGAPVQPRERRHVAALVVFFTDHGPEMSGLSRLPPKATLTARVVEFCRGRGAIWRNGRFTVKCVRLRPLSRSAIWRQKNGAVRDITFSSDMNFYRR